MLAQKIGRQDHPGRGTILRARPDSRVCREASGCGPGIGMRVKLASRGSGRWQASGGFRSKFGLTVGELAKGLDLLGRAGHGRLLPAAPLPSGQPDHQHPPHQDGAQRGLADLHRAGQAGGGPAIPRRRRRAGHRLRRLADQLRVERQLQPAGICQRRGLPRAKRLRRGGGAPSDDHLGKRPGRGRLPQRAGLRRAGGLGAGRHRRGDRAAGRRRAAAGRPLRDLPEHQRPQSAGELSRRPAVSRHGA